MVAFIGSGSPGGYSVQGGDPQADSRSLIDVRPLRRRLVRVEPTEWSEEMKIVVPLDLSTTATKAIEPAVEVARRFGDEVVFVTVGGRRLRSDLEDVARTEHTTVDKIIGAYLASTASEVEDVAADFSVIPGDDAADALVEFASNDETIRMIVIASHGRSGIERLRLGSIAERVVRHSDVPVLVVPARTGT